MIKDTKLNEPTNLNSMKSPKLLIQRIRIFKIKILVKYNLESVAKYFYLNYYFFSIFIWFDFWINDFYLERLDTM